MCKTVPSSLLYQEPPSDTSKRLGDTTQSGSEHVVFQEFIEGSDPGVPTKGVDIVKGTPFRGTPLRGPRNGVTNVHATMSFSVDTFLTPCLVPSEVAGVYVGRSVVRTTNLYEKTKVLRTGEVLSPVLLNDKSFVQMLRKKL